MISDLWLFIPRNALCWISQKLNLILYLFSGLFKNLIIIFENWELGWGGEGAKEAIPPRSMCYAILGSSIVGNPSFDQWIVRVYLKKCDYADFHKSWIYFCTCVQDFLKFNNLYLRTENWGGVRGAKWGIPPRSMCYAILGF